MKYEIIGDSFPVLLGGEGLFLGRLTGPGKVWLQTLPITGIQRAVAASIPTS